jgi:hypothetical protein
LQDGRVITIPRNKDTERHVGASKDYCVGNTKKNEAILALCRHDPRKETDIYLLVKELGDVLQVVLAFLMKKCAPTDAIDVVGTLDDVVRSLCDFFKINCMYQERGRIEQGTHAVCYRKFAEDPETAKRSANRLKKRDVNVVNEHVMTCIRTTIDENSLYMGEKNYLRDMAYAQNKPHIVAFLESIIDAINHVQARIEAIDTNRSTKDYAVIVLQYQATKIIDEKRKAIQAVFRVFPKGLAEAEDPKFRHEQQMPSRSAHSAQYPHV